MKTKVLLLTFFALFNVTFLSGCDFISNNVDVCSLINCDQLGIVDYQGISNADQIPNGPNYDLDPLCTYPGMCGPNYWYPNATSNPTDVTPATGAQ
ncbi:MAG: hypothetical protein GX629_06375 [Phycisphaerae bacterium]|nr:hypothetical protein [Phycisphaerae bacterium]